MTSMAAMTHAGACAMARQLVTSARYPSQGTSASPWPGSYPQPRKDSYWANCSINNATAANKHCLWALQAAVIIISSSSSSEGHQRAPVRDCFKGSREPCHDCPP